MTVIDVSAGGAFDLPGTGATGWYIGCALKAGADAASVTITEKTSGKLLGGATAALGANVTVVLPFQAQYVSGVVVTLTGTTPKVSMFVG